MTARRGSLIAQDMSGDDVLARDWVFDGNRVWEVLDVAGGGRLVCRDPLRLSAEQVAVDLDASSVAKVRADRADDPRYLRAVYEQAQVLRAFWSDAT